MQHCTTIEQSKKLVELGLNPNTADMFYNEEPDEYCPKDIVDTKYPMVIREGQKHYLKEYGIPCWSLGALMNLLPPSIQTGEGMQNQYEIKIRKYWGDDENLYQIAYGNDRGLSEEWHDMINTGERVNLTDAVLDMVYWLLKNGYIKKGK